MAVQKKPRTARTIINELIEHVNNNIQRLRVVEQSLESTTSRVESLEQAMLQQRRETQKLLVDINAKIAELDSKVSRSDSTVKEIVNHMKKLVTEAQLKELETLIDIYNPVKSSFVTREELEKMLKEKKEYGRTTHVNNK